MEKKWWIGNDDADPLLPKREVEHEHRCLCDLVSVHIVDGSPWESHDRCGESVSNPDQPFCNNCEAAGHADLPQYRKEGSHG